LHCPSCHDEKGNSTEATCLSVPSSTTLGPARLLVKVNGMETLSNDYGSGKYVRQNLMFLLEVFVSFISFGFNLADARGARRR